MRRVVGLAPTNGLLVMGVEPDGPAAAAGLDQGDLIQTVSGDEIHSTGDLERALNQVRERVTIGVRPESFHLVPPGQGLPMEAVMVEELGAYSFVHGVTEINGTRRQLIVRAGARGDVSRGDVVHVAPEPAGVHVFDTDTGARLGD